VFLENIAYANCTSSEKKLDKGKKDEDDYSCRCIKGGTECNLNKDLVLL
jgi:hypothetical protein